MANRLIIMTAIAFILSLKARRNLVVACQSMPMQNRHPITILGGFSLSGGWIGGGSVGAAILGLQHINQNSSLLPKYYLNMTWSDTKCQAGSGVEALFNQLSIEPVKMLVLAASCSVSTIPQTQFSQHFKILQLSYAAASPLLNNRKKYPNFFRTYPSDTNLNPTRIQLCKRFKWKNIAIIYENDDTRVFYEALKPLLTLAKENNITITALQSFIPGSDPLDALMNIKEVKTKIIVGGFYAKASRAVFCRAYHLNLTGPSYVWMIYGWYGEQWWKTPNGVHIGDVYCNNSQMEQAVEGYFSTEAVPISVLHKKTISGLTPSEWVNIYSKYQEHPKLPKGSEELAAFTYDAVWAIALMLNQSIPKLEAINKSLHNFKYYDQDFYRILKEEMSKVSFLGITGPVTFSSTGDRLGPMLIERQVNGKEIAIGRYYTNLKKTVWNYSVEMEWKLPGNRTPTDQVKIITVDITVPLSIYISMSALACCGIIMCIGFIIINISYKRYKIIKLLSPNLSNFIAVGAILCYISVILLDRYTELAPIHGLVAILACLGEVWFRAIGFTMAFAALFAKTWRIKTIFNSTIIVKRKVMRDRSLYGIVFAAVLVDIILLSLQLAIDTTTIEIKNQYVSSELNGYEDTIYNYIRHECTSQYAIAWSILLWGTNGVLLFYGAFLAWKTRKIQLSVANDSKFIGLAIYNVTIFVSLGIFILALKYELNHKKDVRLSIHNLSVNLRTITRLHLNDFEPRNNLERDCSDSSLDTKIHKQKLKILELKNQLNERDSIMQRITSGPKLTEESKAVSTSDYLDIICDGIIMSTT
ncbi:Gamma-aminobutyric acid type B receptor subunit 2 [Trichoplax sp. H2]|nr:Gamma-aminobutyric acid type B receptor subunit 2 [Trichoplax sp. H2]|eukprot:RDD41746.1 Gamma-aminobutyric acid type B receptor subunit 2 [Trichoplax sp. H2]